MTRTLAWLADWTFTVLVYVVGTAVVLGLVGAGVGLVAAVWHGLEVVGVGAAVGVFVGFEAGLGGLLLGGGETRLRVWKGAL